ncbi:hypothetical protein KM043_012236 [Ampulex compressa]|nr:hypothetical protein KM043_012236 [Ampulex compressa]
MMHYPRYDHSRETFTIGRRLARKPSRPHSDGKNIGALTAVVRNTIINTSPARSSANSSFPPRTTLAAPPNDSLLVLERPASEFQFAADAPPRQQSFAWKQARRRDAPIILNETASGMGERTGCSHSFPAPRSSPWRELVSRRELAKDILDSSHSSRAANGTLC